MPCFSNPNMGEIHKQFPDERRRAGSGKRAGQRAERLGAEFAGRHCPLFTGDARGMCMFTGNFFYREQTVSVGVGHVCQ